MLQVSCDLVVGWNDKNGIQNNKKPKCAFPTQQCRKTRLCSLKFKSVVADKHAETVTYRWIRHQLGWPKHNWNLGLSFLFRTGQTKTWTSNPFGPSQVHILVELKSRTPLGRVSVCGTNEILGMLGKLQCHFNSWFCKKVNHQWAKVSRTRLAKAMKLLVLPLLKCETKRAIYLLADMEYQEHIQ